MAMVSVGGARYKASLQMIDNANVGDYVLLHAGFALQKLSEEDARETLRLFDELEDINNQDEALT